MLITEELIEPGLSRLEDITAYLNKVVKTKGDIKRDDANIWRRLHRWTNEDWAEMILVACEIMRTHPEYVSEDQRRKITRAKYSLEALWDEHPRVLDTPDLKTPAWGALMSMREVLNQARDGIIKNQEALLRKRHKGLFE